MRIESFVVVRGAGRARDAHGARRTRPLLAIASACVGLGLGFPLGLAGCGSESPERGAPSSSTSPPQATQVLPGGALRTATQAGRFVITIRPEPARIPIGPLHAWIVEVTTPDGRPAAIRQLVFDGGMPQHGHGFETAPQVTGALGDGIVRVDGVRFHMAGDWKLRVDVAEAGSADVAYFDVTVVP